MNTENTEPNEGPTFAATSEAARMSGATPPEAVGRVRGRLLSTWRFTRHLLEMLLAMFAGMGVFYLVIWVVGEPPGYSNLLVEYGLMGASMSAAMVAWMRFRGHSWFDGLEMSAAMLAPMFAVVFPVEFGAVELGGHALMMLTHVAMIGGMVALMTYRRDRYAHGARAHRA